jgi:hypothetical protein
MTMTRREMCLLLPAAALSGAAAPLMLAGEQDNSLPSAGFPFEKLTAKSAASGAQIREILKGKLVTGESLETHATTLPAGPCHTRRTVMYIRKCFCYERGRWS